MFSLDVYAYPVSEPKESADEQEVLDDEDVHFAHSATLRIFGAIPDLDEITLTLKLQPTNVHRRGERRGPQSPLYKHDMWSYLAPVPEERPLQVHVDTLWSHLRPHQDYLLGLKSRLTVDVICGYRSNSGTAGIEVPYASLEMFTVLEIPFGLSIIVA